MTTMPSVSRVRRVAPGVCALVLSAALRFYQPEILGRLLSGKSLGAADLAFIADHLKKNDQEIAKTLARIAAH